MLTRLSLSTVLVGISAAFAVIVLKTFAHWVFFCYVCQWNIKIRINSILPIIGIVLTVLVVKSSGRTIQKGLQILYLLLKKQV
jgi:CIC family chloride channel protein